MAFTCSYKPIFENKKKILFVFSHPDDAEIYAGGTIDRLTSEGKEVRIVKMTSGNKGSRKEEVTEKELSETREKENDAAMRALGITEENNVFLGLGDGEIENDLKTIGLIAKQIREFKPDLVVTHNPEHKIIRFAKNENWVNHRDHKNTGLSAVDAVYPYSRDLLFFPEHFKEKNVESHSVTEMMFVDYYDHEDTIFIDITDSVEKKSQAISAHKSQFSQEHAKEIVEFFSKLDDSGRMYERFRYVIAD